MKNVIALRDRMFDPFERQFNDFFNDFFKQSNLASIKSKGNFPKLDVYSTEKEWVIEASMAGVNLEDIEVEIIESPKAFVPQVLPGAFVPQTLLKNKVPHPLNQEENIERSVRIGCKCESRKENAQYYTTEWSRSYSERNVILPDNIVGDPEVTLKNGVLKLTWKWKPKDEPKKKLIKVKNLD